MAVSPSFSTKAAIAGVFAVMLATIQIGHASGAQASPWPPSDPAQARATVAFTPDWAAKLRGSKGLGDIQRATGAAGRIISAETQKETPYVVFEWTDPLGGRMRAHLYQDGAFSAAVWPAGVSQPILLNSFDAFVCASCTPPANACGLRPSWVPHDLHWDDFDCPRTIMGPQTLDPAKM